MYKTGRKMLLLFLLCGSMTLPACGKEKLETFDYGRYQGEDIQLFLEDFDLTLEDMESFDAGTLHTYQSKTELPFMNSEAMYYFVCDEQDKITYMEVYLGDQLENAEGMYAKALEIEKAYEEIETAEYYFDSFEGEPEPEKSVSTDEFGNTDTITSYLGVVPSASDIQKYPTYDEWKNANETLKIKSVVGIWNLEDSVQVRITYGEAYGEAYVRVKFCDSESSVASPFGNANKGE